MRWAARGSWLLAAILSAMPSVTLSLVILEEGVDLRTLGAGDGGPSLGEGDRPDPVHRLPRMHHGVQVGERGAARRSTARTSSPSTSGSFPQARRAFQVTRCNQCDDAPCVDRLPDRRDVPADDGIVDFDKQRLHRLQGVHRRLPVRRDLHQPRGPLGREVQLLRAPDRRRPRAGLRGRLPDRGDPRRRPERPGLEGRAARAARGRSRFAGPEKETRPEALLPGRAPGDARPAGRAPARRRPLHVERAAARDRSTSGPPRAREQLGSRAARLRRPAPRAVGLAGQPLHLDEGHRRGRLPRPLRPARSSAGWLGWSSSLWLWAAPAARRWRFLAASPAGC